MLFGQLEADPSKLLEQTSPTRMLELAEDGAFLQRMRDGLAAARSRTEPVSTPLIAYFCMEFGITAHLHLYAGGLGVLAGDHLKTASDLGLPLCGVGLAYAGGYMRQPIDARGAQQSPPDRTHWGGLEVEAVVERAARGTVDRLPHGAHARGGDRPGA